MGHYKNDMNPFQIFDLEGLRWREGPEFPGHVVEGAYTQYANSFIIVGGVDPETGGNDKYGDQVGESKTKKTRTDYVEEILLR